jgi:hypothetical protein
MPAVGRKPKPEDQRRNKSQPRMDWIDVLDVPYDGEVPNPGRLPARSKRWWDTVTRMAHCVIWTEGDWQFAIDTAHVHAAWVREGKSGDAVELRMREKILGTTWDARRDLRIRYVAGVTDEEDATPTALDEYRKALAE